MAKQGKFTSYLVNRVGIQTLLVLGVIVFGFLVVDDIVMRHDLTEDQRFSISQSSHDLAEAIEDPLTIRAFFSNNIPERIVPLQRQVFDILAEYEAHGGGKIKIERVDPLERKTAENEAKEYGIQPIRLFVHEGTERVSLEVYGSLALIYRDQRVETIDIAQRYPEGYQGLSALEYEISSKIWQLTNDKPTIGICGQLESQPPAGMMPGRTPPPRPEFQGLRRELGKEFNLKTVDLKAEELDPKKTPLLLVIRPRDFTDVEVFRLDQFLMKGGRVLMFVTQGEIQQSRPPPGSRQRFLWRYLPFQTGLDKWLEHHGVRVPNEFVVHQHNGWDTSIVQVVETNLGKLPVERPAINWFWPKFGLEGSINQDNPATQKLKVALMFWPHPIDVLPDGLGEKKSTILMQSHAEESWRWKDTNRADRRYLTSKDIPPPSALKSSPVAVAVEGTFSSYFAKNAAPPSLGTKKEGEEGDEKEGEKKDESKGPDIVKTSVAPTQLVVIGNALMVSDMVLGGNNPSPEAKGVALLAFNLVDWLARSSELIALRAKQYTDRALLDPDFKSDTDELAEKYKNQEIDDDEYREAVDGLRDKQKSRFKRWRWVNVLVPCLLTLVAGALVWILRSAARAGKADVPDSVPPHSVQD